MKISIQLIIVLCISCLFLFTDLLYTNMNRTSKINDDFKQNDIVQKYGEFTDVNTSQQRFCHQSELSNFSIVSLGSPMEIIDINHLLNDTLLVFQISNRQCYTSSEKI